MSIFNEIGDFEALQTINVLDYDYFCGIDVDKKSNVITLFDRSKKLFSKKLPSDPKNLINFIKRKYPQKKVVFCYEAGCTGFGLYFALRNSGYDCLVVTPSDVPGKKKDMVKTNKIDSFKIGDALKGGSIKGVRVPSKKYLELRDMVHVRDSISQNTKAIKQRIKALLLSKSLDFPDPSIGSSWSLAVQKELSESKKFSFVRTSLDSLLEQLTFYHKQGLKINREIREFCKSDPELMGYIIILKSHPGVGWVVASQILARIGDPKNLKNCREMGHFLGLTPREKSTGDDPKRGAITKMGDKRTRCLLIQSAWSSIRKDMELVDFFVGIASRNNRDHGRAIAIVAVARKITHRLSSMLMEGRLYQTRAPKKKHLEKDS